MTISITVGSICRRLKENPRKSICYRYDSSKPTRIQFYNAHRDCVLDQNIDPDDIDQMIADLIRIRAIYPDKEVE